MNFEKAEQFRTKHPFLPDSHSKGDKFGWFVMPSPCVSHQELRCMVAPDDSEWQHISISMDKRCPNWVEMSYVKDLFFDEEDVVVQFHPKKSEYVNMAKTCLHLWRWTGGEFPTPPSILVGV